MAGLGPGAVGWLVLGWVGLGRRCHERIRGVELDQQYRCVARAAGCSLVSLVGTLDLGTA